MCEELGSKRYLYSTLEERDPFGEGACGSMSQLHRMSGFGEGRGRGGAELGLASEGSDSSQDPPAPPRSDRKMVRSLHEDAEMNGSGSSGSGTESHSNESHGNDSNGNESLTSSNGNGKDSALLESSGSNKRLVCCRAWHMVDGAWSAWLCFVLFVCFIVSVMNAGWAARWLLRLRHHSDGLIQIIGHFTLGWEWLVFLSKINCFISVAGWLAVRVPKSPLTYALGIPFCQAHCEGLGKQAVDDVRGRQEGKVPRMSPPIHSLIYQAAAIAELF